MNLSSMLDNILQQEKLSDKEYGRYVRQIIVDKIKIEGQNRLKNGRIICIGAGGLNAPTLIYLAAIGIGKIGVIDNDRIELSNLHRQIIYKDKDVGKKKAFVAHEILSSLNQCINIVSYDEKLTKDNIVEILSGYEIIIDGTDNFQARYLISQYCYKLHKIHIYGAIEKFTGQVSIFNYQNSSNYHNLYGKISYSQFKNCSNVGIINTLAGITGLLQATEAVKIIIGIGATAGDQLIVFNMLECSLSKIKIKPGQLVRQKITRRKTKNQSCYRKYISDQEIGKYMNSIYKLIDIRTDIEFKLDRKQNGINIPLEILKQQESIRRLKELVKRYRIVIYCSNTIRSHIASQILEKHTIMHYILTRKRKARKERDSNPR